MDWNPQGGFEAGATVSEAQIKKWLKGDLKHIWGNQPLHAITGAEMLNDLRGAASFAVD